MEKKLDLILQEIGSMKQDISTMKQDINTMKQDISTMKQDIGSLQQDVGTLQEGLQTTRAEMKSRFDTLETRMELGFKEVKDKLNSVEQQTANLSESHSQMAVKLDSLLEDQKSIHEILGEHEVSIRSLRRKPVSTY